MKIFQSEIDAGLEKKIRANASVGFVSEILEKTDSLPKIDLDLFSKSDITDDDVYQVYSILVSTVWNLNDDIFLKEPVWAARNTPKYKPTNLNHDEKLLVGGIVDVWPIDLDMKLIADTTPLEEIPDHYHLLVSSVIYRQWQNPELRARAEHLISEIEDGSKFVSMECIFKGFDYGIITPDGDRQLVARNESTAFLTQHLRAYGGDGVYQDHKIGRALNSITFSGKGYVDKPANPGSIIFDSKKVFSFAGAKLLKSSFLNDNGVDKNTEKQQLPNKEKSMSDILEQQNSELKASLDKALAQIEELKTALSKADIVKFENQIKDLEASVAALKAEKEAVEAELQAEKEKAESAEKSLEEKSKAFDELSESFDKMKEEEKKKDRKAKMADAGMAAADIEAKYETFAGMDDDQFNAFIDTVKAMKPSKEESTSASESDDDDDEVDASEVVDEDSVEEGDHAVSGEVDDELKTARAGLTKWVEQNILNK